MQHTTSRKPAILPKYKSVTEQQPSDWTTFDDHIDYLRNDEQLRKNTDHIRDKYSTHMAQLFKDRNGDCIKSSSGYQDDKRKLLTAAGYDGCDRSKNKNGWHTGLFAIDCDEIKIPKRQYLKIKKLINAGLLPFIVASDYSVNAIAGHQWLLIAAEIPDIYQADADTKKEIHNDWNEYIKNKLSNIVLVHENYTGNEFKDSYVIRVPDDLRYSIGIQHAEKLSIPADHFELSRLRYDVAATDLYVNKEAFNTPLTYDELLDYKEAQKKVTAKFNKYKKSAGNINASDKWEFCEKHADHWHTDGYSSGNNRHLWLLHFCNAALMVGIDKDECWQHINTEYSEYDHVKNNHFREAYSEKNTGYFGCLEHKIKTESCSVLDLPDDAPRIYFDDYISNSSDINKLYDHIDRNKRTALVAPTAAGKSTLSRKNLYEHIKTNDDKALVVFTAPLSAIVSQSGTNTDLPDIQVICKGHDSVRSAACVDSIITYNSLYDWTPTLLNYIETNGLNLYLIVDEVHQIFTAAGYQNTAFLPDLFTYCHKVISMSATSVSPLWQRYNFKPFICVRNKDFAPDVQLSYEKTIKQNVDGRLSELLKDQDRKTLTFLQSKKRIRRLSKALNKSGLRSGYVDGPTKHENDIYKSIITDKQLPGDIDHVLSTAVLNDGIDINEPLTIVFVMSYLSNDLISFLQALHRSRTDNINIHLLFVTDGQVEDDNTPADDTDDSDTQAGHYKINYWIVDRRHDHYSRYVRTANKSYDQLHQLNNAFNAETKPLKNNIPAEISANVYECPIKRQLKVNSLNIINDQIQRVFKSYKPDDIIEQLPKYIDNLTMTELAADQQTVDDNAAILDKQIKEDEAATLEFIINAWSDNDQRSAIFTYIHDTVKHSDQRLSARIKASNYYNKYSDINKELKDAIIDRYDETRSAVSRYFHLRDNYRTITDDRLTYYCFLSNGTYNRKLRQLNSLYNIGLLTSDDGLLNDDKIITRKDVIRKQITYYHYQLIKFAEQYIGKEECTIKAMHDAAAEMPFYEALNMNEKNWTMILQMFFEISKRVKKVDDIAKRHILIKRKLQLTDLLHDLPVTTSTDNLLIRKNKDELVTDDNAPGNISADHEQLTPFNKRE